jgi:hypothetical protein
MSIRRRLEERELRLESDLVEVLLDQLADLLGLRIEAGWCRELEGYPAAGLGELGFRLVGIEAVERRMRRPEFDAGCEMAVGNERLAADQRGYRFAIETPRHRLAQAEIGSDRILVHAEPDRLDFRCGHRDELGVAARFNQGTLVGNDPIDDLRLAGRIAFSRVCASLMNSRVICRIFAGPR